MSLVFHSGRTGRDLFTDSFGQEKELPSVLHYVMGVELIKDRSRLVSGEKKPSWTQCAQMNFQRARETRSAGDPGNVFKISLSKRAQALAVA